MLPSLNRRWVVFCSLFTVFLLLSSLPELESASVRKNYAIMMQGFGWNSQARGSPSRWYNLIAARAKDLSDMGVTMVWFPPMSRSVSPQGYLPGDYYDLGTPERPTFYGDKGQLANALSELRKYKVMGIADIVINHRCAGKQDPNGIWNIFHFPSQKAQWEQWAVCKGQFGGTGNSDSGDGFHAAPDIDHSNSTVQRDIIEWMTWLRKLGFAGWRYDYSKGYHPKYAAIYDKATRPVFSVGEIWTNMSFSGSHLNPNQDSHRQTICDWLDKAGNIVCAFDFTTKGILQVAVHGEYWRLKDSKEKAAGLIGWWPERAVTFIDNHDTGSQQNHWPFPREKVMQGYAYILTHPGVPCIFWEHVYDWKLKDAIKKLTAIRREYHIHSGSKLEIIEAKQGLYAAVIDGKIAVKLGWIDWSPGSSFKLLTHGDQFAVWGKTPSR